MLNAIVLKKDLESIFKEVDKEYFIDEIARRQGFYLFKTYKFDKKLMTKGFNLTTRENIYFLEYEYNDLMNNFLIKVHMKFLNPEISHTVFLFNIDVSQTNFGFKY